MNQKTHKKILKIRYGLFDKYSNNNILAAISGGQDSIYLIETIERIRKELLFTDNIKIKTSYIYIDHQWRKDSYRHIIHLTNYIKSIGNKIAIYQLSNKIKSEQQSRTYRYHIIIMYAVEHRFDLVVTGHNQTDKIETFLYNLFRGCGTEGTTSLVIGSRINNITYLNRPLLNLNRNQIYWYCKKFRLPIWSDTTNYAYKVSRNRTRYELLPYLKNYFNQNIENTIYRVLTNYYNDNEYIKKNTIKLYLANIHTKYIAINYTQIIKQDFSIQFKVLQLFISHNVNINMGSKEILGILKKVNTETNDKQIEIKVDVVKMYLLENWIYLAI